MGFNELELFMGISEKYLLSFLLFFLLLLTKLKKQQAKETLFTISILLLFPAATRITAL